MAYTPADWHDFFVMTGGAAAALTGLLFVAMSLHAKTIMENRFFSSRAVGTLMSLTSQLLLSGAVLLPGQPVTWLGVEVELVALFFLGMTMMFFMFAWNIYIAWILITEVSETG